MDITTFIPVAEAARRKGVNRSTIQRAVAAGRLRGIQPGREILVDAAALEKYQPGKPGRQRGSKDRVQRRRRWRRRPVEADA